MSLRQLLTYAHEDPAVDALSEAAAKAPQRVFVSSSLRPYLLAALADLDGQRPALIVAGDDRRRATWPPTSSSSCTRDR